MLNLDHKKTLLRSKGEKVLNPVSRRKVLKKGEIGKLIIAFYTMVSPLKRIRLQKLDGTTQHVQARNMCELIDLLRQRQGRTRLLPDGWQAVRSRSVNKIYYFNRDLLKSQWARPEGPTPSGTALMFDLYSDEDHITQNLSYAYECDLVDDQELTIIYKG